MALGAILGAAGGLLGAIGGAQGSRTSGSTSSGMNLASASELEKEAQRVQLERFKQLGQFTDVGPNQNDVQVGYESQRSLADMLSQYGQGGYMPTQADYASAGQFADATLGASFRQQEEQAARLSARLGRPVNDQVLQAKLRQGLGEQRGAMVAQQAQQMPLQRLGYMAQATDMRSALASQAMANRQAMLGLGSQISGAERNFRIQTAERWGESSQTSGGGLAGAISGGLGGLGAGLGAANSLGGMGINSFSDIFGGKSQQMMPSISTEEALQMQGSGPRAASPMRSRVMPAATSQPSYDRGIFGKQMMLPPTPF